MDKLIHYLVNIKKSLDDDPNLLVEVHNTFYYTDKMTDSVAPSPKAIKHPKGTPTIICVAPIVKASSEERPRKALDTIPDNIENTCYEYLRKTKMQLVRLLQDALNPLKITVGEFLTLWGALICENREQIINLTNIQAYLHTHQSTLAKDINKLKNKRYLCLLNHPKRMHIYNVTFAGYSLFKTAHPLWIDAERTFKNKVNIATS